jgi:acyl-CoA dehydrogenase
MLLVLYCKGAAVRAVQLTAVERVRVKQFCVMQTYVLGLSEAVKAAADNADDVDRNARFPVEAIDAPKAANLLSWSLPTDLGGRSSRISALALIARALGWAPSSADMVFRMHHTRALTLAVHGRDGEIAERTAKVAANESLPASATTEVATGGDIGSSSCAISVDGTNVLLRRHAPVISYAESADYVCATARRGADSPPSEQVLLVCPASDTTPERTRTGDVLGLRGTCSPDDVLTTRTAGAPQLMVSNDRIRSNNAQPVLARRGQGIEAQ